MLKPIVLLKLGGSFLTAKDGRGTLHEERVRQAGREIREALAVEPELPLVLGHGAGSFGHQPANHYSAVAGVHLERGWEGFHVIRRAMDALRLRLLGLWAEEGFFPVPLQPSATIVARDGRLIAMDCAVLFGLLERGQVPLIHGDVVLDEQRGFTIVSTERQFEHLARQRAVARAIMVTDVPGVLDDRGQVIPRLTAEDLCSLPLGGAAVTDVTGGMRHKVEALLSILECSPGAEALIISGLAGEGALKDALLGQARGGTVVVLR
jgi:isopentenyl phosphate kinase